MSAQGWLQVVVFFAALAALTVPLGAYLHRVYQGPTPPGGAAWLRVERVLLASTGSRGEGQSWREYVASLLAFSAVSVLVTYAVLRFQGGLPFNPQALPGVESTLAFNTAVSFVTNTNWQSYGGESTMSHLSQAGVLAWNNFVSAAAGVGVAMAMVRGLAGAGTLGNFWVDLVRGTFLVLLPACLVLALFLVTQGVVQDWDACRDMTTLEGARQVLALGPVASQVAIKQLGTNGGGFFNANGAHPFENPTPLSGFVQALAILCIPAALTHTFGRMVGDTRQGWVLFASMSLLFLVGVGATGTAESAGNAAVAAAGVSQPAGNLEGKEVRFGIPQSVLWTTATTDASNGSVNSMLDSYTPLGGLVPLVNIHLGEVVFGGVGVGLMGMLVMVLLAVFLAGLMVGRTPEYLGRKVEAREMKLVTLYILVMPTTILVLTAWACVSDRGLSSLNNAGPHGLSEILYAYSSAAGNNGSAFAGLNANTAFFNLTLGLAMLVGRFWLIVPALAVAGSMSTKRVVPPGPGTFPTHTVLFSLLLTAVVVVVGALTFFPALTLGPVVEHFLAAAGKAF